MKSPYRIAKELAVSPQSVYQKIEKIQEQLKPYIKRNGNKILIDEQGESLLKSTFSNSVKQGIEQEKSIFEQETEQDLLNQLNNHLNTENEYLRNQNKNLLEELNKEREYSRQQSENLSELSNKLVELTKNEQILALQKNKNPLLLADEQPSELKESETTNKKTIWYKLFKNKKNK